MGFTNRIRLPFQLTKPQFPEDKSVYRFADGRTKTLSVVVKKTYSGETDYLPEKWHQRLVIALAHDNVTVEGDRYLGGVSKDGDYTINWPEFLDFPTGKAAFSVNVTPFDNTNSNCMTCEQAQQVALQDTVFPETLEENTTYAINVLITGSVCCYPAVFSITSYNTDYLDSATIDQSGVLTIHTKNDYSTANGIKLVTYRVTCPNGGYDEADVSGDLEGTAAPTCIAPSNIVFSNITTTTVDISFTAAPGPPDHYLWRLYKTAAPGVLVQTGTCTTTLSLSGLDTDTQYTWYVRSQCGAGNDDATASNFIDGTFTTPINTVTCGRYRARLMNTKPQRPTPATITYLDCSGTYVVTHAATPSGTPFCALQTSAGNPVYIESSTTTDGTYVTIDYEGPCT